MMNATMPSFPSALGQNLISGVSNISAWGFAKFMSAPVQNMALGAVGIAIVMSTGNALYWQNNAHPSPFFATSGNLALNVQNAGEIAPLIVPPHPLDLAVGRAANARAAAQTAEIQNTPQAPVAAVEGEVTNEMLSKAQEVLASLGLFSGKVDGFYGPLTAQAIRSFETQNGLSPKGSMSFSIINKIIGTPQGVLPAVISPPIAASQPVPQIIPVVSSSNANVAQPLPVGTDVLSQIVNDVAQTPVVTQVAVTPSMPVVSVAPTLPQIDKALIEKIQRGLATLGFYNSSLDGIAGESTAKAIRQFENFMSFPMTGQVNEQILQWLEEAGAFA